MSYWGKFHFSKSYRDMALLLKDLSKKKKKAGFLGEICLALLWGDPLEGSCLLSAEP